MAYVNNNGVNPAIPSGSSPAVVDDDMRDIKLAYNERFDDFFGVNWAVDDPIEPTKIGPAVSIQGKQVGTPIFDAGNSGTTKAINFNDGDQQKVTLTGNVTFSFSNVVAGRTYLLYLVQDGVGGRTCTFPTSAPAVRSSNNTNFGTPSLTTTASRLSIVSLTAYTSGILVASIVATGVNAV
jgi:hypothetical protein